MIDKLKNLTDDFIKTNKDNPKELKRFQLIKEILNQDDCFLSLDIEYAYSILRDLNIPESELKDIYLQLI